MGTEKTTRLLLLCSRPDPTGSEEREAVRLVESGPDWAELEAAAVDEGTAPLVHRSLGNLIPPVSGPGPERFKTHYLRNVGRNVRLFALLEPFLAAVCVVGARVALIKGARLALTVYPEPGFRPFGDVDCVVHPGDWPAVESALRETGFGEAPVSGDRPDLSDPRFHWIHSPYYRKGELLLEVHFNCLGLHFPFRSEKDFWGSVARLPVLGSEALVLSPEYELATVCLHAEQHSFRKLMWLADIAGLVSRTRVEWDRLASICDREKVRSSVSYALHLVETVWPGTMPGEAGARFFARPRSWRIHRSLWPEREVTRRTPPPPWPYYMPSVLSLWERKNPVLAIRALAAILFPPRAWMAAVSDGSAKAPGGPAGYLRRIFRPLGLAARRIFSR